MRRDEPNRHHERTYRLILGDAASSPVSPIDGRFCDCTVVGVVSSMARSALSQGRSSHSGGINELPQNVPKFPAGDRIDVRRTAAIRNTALIESMTLIVTDEVHSP